ncbi:MAG: U-box domain-containing protein, partial [Candidatus Pacebacteria bacterium]|nr:U-box domain-containing protein [Candidatus Paceibacterota bacterium]
IKRYKKELAVRKKRKARAKKLAFLPVERRTAPEKIADSKHAELQDLVIGQGNKGVVPASVDAVRAGRSQGLHDIVPAHETDAEDSVIDFVEVAEPEEEPVEGLQPATVLDTEEFNKRVDEMVSAKMLEESLIAAAKEQEMKEKYEQKEAALRAELLNEQIVFEEIRKKQEDARMKVEVEIESSRVEAKVVQDQIRVVDEMLGTYECPISCELVKDPVVAEDGHTYERQDIESWLRSHNVSPMTLAVIGQNLVPNHKVRAAVGELAEYKKKLEGRLADIHKLIHTAS